MEPTSEMVYIVDDDPRVREGLSSLLRANGKSVRIFSSGQEFLNFRREDSCACLILDLKMPGLGGLEVQRAISAKTSIPVIFITGRGDIPSTVTAMKGGAVDFLTKPVDEAAPQPPPTNFVPNERHQPDLLEGVPRLADLLPSGSP
jgi:FixJ family two-component response regulator